MKTLVQLIAALGILFGMGERGFAQGFVNLNFERAQLFLPTPPPPGVEVDPALAFNGWTITNTMGPGMDRYVFTRYDNLTLGSSCVALISSQFLASANIFGGDLTPLQGSYSVLLQGFHYTNFTGLPGMFQRNRIPINMRSISFLTTAEHGYGRLMLDGTDIPLVPIGNNRIAGDISAFVGRDVDMMISTIPGGGFFFFDDIQFSTASVPEPSIWAIVILGMIAFTFTMKRRVSKR